MKPQLLLCVCVFWHFRSSPKCLKLLEVKKRNNHLEFADWSFHEIRINTLEDDSIENLAVISRREMVKSYNQSANLKNNKNEKLHEIWYNWFLFFTFETNVWINFVCINFQRKIFDECSVINWSSKVVQLKNDMQRMHVLIIVEWLDQNRLIDKLKWA